MKERRLVLSFDLDDVMVHTAYKVLDHYKDQHGHVVNPIHFYEGTAQDWGLENLKDVNRRIEGYFRSKKFEQDGMIPDPEAVIAISALALKHELHVITGRPKFMERFTGRLIDEHFPNCFQSITHTNFFKRRDRRTKGQVCRDLGVDVHTDDHLVHCESVLDEGIEYAIAHGDYEWNRREIVRKGLIRSMNWDTTLTEINNIAAA